MVANNPFQLLNLIFKKFQSVTDLMADSNNLFIFFSSGLGFHWFFLLKKEIKIWDGKISDTCEIRTFHILPFLHIFCCFNKVFSWF